MGIQKDYALVFCGKNGEADTAQNENNTQYSVVYYAALPVATWRMLGQSSA
jgi:hypothetical protein